MTENSGGFFSRWSQRKQAVKLGLAEEDISPNKVQDKPQPSVQNSEVSVANVKPESADPAAEPPKLPTLSDVEQLTPDSDFSTFMTQGVSPEVRNAAMKKLFTDPHYNVMDGLDIYIGDYNTPDPLPAGMLAKMVGAQFLGLVKAPEDVAQSSTSDGDTPKPAETKLAANANNLDNPEPLENNSVQHDHTHLRLQSNHAPADPEAGSGAG
ncbi:DUF3306 domain-containing protein [Limnohabitans sp. Hippo4]|uniref:DUF3306 domain-containing protein n=1 Tax=Limnohabitans sp. Hippo4 TaxID=1826167 RepID=UPI000D381927|nr:DUF3306 domain-containing protein [Limnohabitans sp. Hippo4]PUE35217.1 hypothetical protein B9Z46_09060 [Limnohabitans sp. Hippo4]